MSDIVKLKEMNRVETLEVVYKFVLNTMQEETNPIYWYWFDEVLRDHLDGYKHSIQRENETFRRIFNPPYDSRHFINARKEINKTPVLERVDLSERFVFATQDIKMGKPEILLWTAWLGDWPRVRALIGENVDVNFSVEYKDFDFMEINWLISSIKSPLFYAALSGETDVLKLLIEHGADVNLGNNILMTVIIKKSPNNLETVKILLAAGADIHAKDRLGQTAFHYAIQSENMEIVKLFLDAGADILAKDNEK